MAEQPLILQGDIEAANPLDRNKHGLFVTLETDEFRRLQSIDNLIMKRFLTRDIGLGRSGGARLGRLKITVERLEEE